MEIILHKLAFERIRGGGGGGCDLGPVYKVFLSFSRKGMNVLLVVGWELGSIENLIICTLCRTDSGYRS